MIPGVRVKKVLISYNANSNSCARVSLNGIYIAMIIPLSYWNTCHGGTKPVHRIKYRIEFVVASTKPWCHDIKLREAVEFAVREHEAHLLSEVVL